MKAFPCPVPPSPASSAQSWLASQAFRLKVNPVPEFLCFHLADGRLWYMLACVVTRTGSHIMTSLKNILKSHVFLCALCVCIRIHTCIHMSWCTCGGQRQPVGVLSLYHVGPGIEFRLSGLAQAPILMSHVVSRWLLIEFLLVLPHWRTLTMSPSVQGTITRHYRLGRIKELMFLPHSAEKSPRSSQQQILCLGGTRLPSLASSHGEERRF